MKESPPAGVPTIEEYRVLLEGDVFTAMEAHSAEFLRENGTALEDYRKRWVSDPLHQWSRQWEYPFVHERLARFAGGGPRAASGGPRILDAGSGVTFFPFFLVSQLSGAEVVCCDYDPTLAEVYAELRAPSRDRVTFDVASLDRLPYGNADFDAVYSISVLEHTPNHEAIVAEFVRVLRPAGLLVLTFDVSLDGDCDVDRSGARRLLRDLENRFTRLEGPSAEELDRALDRPGALTTNDFRRSEPSLLPWRGSLLGVLRDLLCLRVPRPEFHRLSVCTCVYRRPAHSEGNFAG